MFTETRLAAEKLLRDPSSAETQVRMALRQLESLDLVHDDFAWVVVNLSLALGFSIPVSVVRQYAIEVVRSGLFRSWEAYAFLRSLEKLAQGEHPGPPPVIPIAALSPGVLRSLSNARVLCAQHMGMFRFIPFALAASGFKVNVLGQGSGFERLRRAIEAARSSTARNRERYEHLRALHALELLDPTKPGMIVRLIKKLRSGELAVIYIAREPRCSRTF